MTEISLGSNVHFPLAGLLSLASRVVGDLYLAQIKEYNRLDSLGSKFEDEATSVMEDANDTRLSLMGIDPAAWWGERQRLASMPEGADQPMERYKQLLQLGLAPKAQYVIPAAVAKFRKDELNKGGSGPEDQGRQNALLDFLVFLSGSRDRATLFKLLPEDED